MRYSINLSTIFTEVPFLERFQKAREAGFKYVECQFPYDYPPEQIQEVLAENHLSLELINLPPGDWSGGDRGLAVAPRRVNEFKASVEKGLTYGVALKVKKIHCMAGILPEGMEQKTVRETYIENLTYAAEKLDEHGITLLIEPINTFDMPGYFLSNLHEAAKIIAEIGRPNVKLQYDFYHIQRIHGNLIANFKKYSHSIGHIQIADVPGRHQPGTGEIHYENIFRSLQDDGFKGLIGLEYTPKGSSEDSFTWMRRDC